MLPQNTVKLLEEYASSSNRDRYIGLLAEIQVVHYYLKQNYKLKSHRQKYFKVEIDLVFENKDKVVLVEVKHLGSSEFLLNRLSREQRGRLERVYLGLSSLESREVEFHYVIVSQQEGIIVYDDFLGS